MSFSHSAVRITLLFLLTAGSQSQFAGAMEVVREPITLESDLRPPFRLVSQRRHEDLRRYLPRVDDSDTQDVLDHPKLIFYTEAEMPRVYQFWFGQLQGVHSVHYNISANDSEPFGNGNIEFPWGTPAGTHRVDNLKSFRFLLLPRDESGKAHPIVYHRRYLSGDSSLGYAWTFPVGAVLGEVLLMHGPDGKSYTFELRMRTREIDDWAVNVFRPFPTALSLAERIRELRPDWQDDEKLARLVNHLEGPTMLTRRTLEDGHPRQAFSQTAGVDELPGTGDPELVAELLTTTKFQSCISERWREDEKGNVAFAPTTRVGFHVVPAKYDAGFIAVDRVSCSRCHSTVNQPVDRFQSGRDWYGRIRGSDGIFSFHPFEPGSVSYNGMANSPSLRQEFIDAGLLAKYDRGQHSVSIYRSLPQFSD